MKTIVKNNTLQLKHVWYAEPGLTFSLWPGINEVDSAQWFSGARGLEWEIDEGLIEVVRKALSDAAPTLGAFKSEAEAVRVVKATVRPELLDIWKDKRPRVKKALDAQRALMELTETEKAGAKPVTHVRTGVIPPIPVYEPVQE